MLHPKTLRSQQVTSGNAAWTYLALCVKCWNLHATVNDYTQVFNFFGGSEPDGKNQTLFFNLLFKLKRTFMVCPLMKKERESQKHKAYTSKEKFSWILVILSTKPLSQSAYIFKWFMVTCISDVFFLHLFTWKTLRSFQIFSTPQTLTLYKVLI